MFLFMMDGGMMMHFHIYIGFRVFPNSVSPGKFRAFLP